MEKKLIQRICANYICSRKTERWWKWSLTTSQRRKPALSSLMTQSTSTTAPFTLRWLTCTMLYPYREKRCIGLNNVHPRSKKIPLEDIPFGQLVSEVLNQYWEFTISTDRECWLLHILYIEVVQNQKSQEIDWMNILGCRTQPFLSAWTSDQSSILPGSDQIQGIYPDGDGGHIYMFFFHIYVSLSLFKVMVKYMFLSVYLFATNNTNWEVLNGELEPILWWIDYWNRRLKYTVEMLEIECWNRILKNKVEV